MGIFDTIFGTKANTESSQQTKTPVENTPGGEKNEVKTPGETHSSAQTDANGLIPKKEESPLDKHKGIWDTKDAVPNPFDKPIFDGLDPAKIHEAVSKNDFTKVLTPELLAKIKGGGDEAASAFAEGLNKVAQSVFANNTVATTQIVEQALAKQQEKFNLILPTLVRKLSANDSLTTENPAFAHPVVQPVVGALQEAFVRKNPNASMAEINAQIRDVMEAMAGVFIKKPPTPTNSKQKSKEMDWEAYLTQ
jgi:hypothetical protein